MSRQKETIQDAVYRELKQAIFNGEFKPGQRLIERELCELLQVSRTPLREALNRLIMEGLLENEPYKGITVPRLTVKEISDLVEIREIIEGLAAKKATENITNEGLLELQAIINDSIKLLHEGNIKGLVSKNDSFHNVIANFSDNTYIKDTLIRLKYRITLARSTSLYVPYRPEVTVNEHIEIFKAMLDRNPELAEEKAREHIRNAGNVAIEAIQQVQETNIKPIRLK